MDRHKSLPAAADALSDGLVELGLNPELTDALRQYRDLLARWNRVYNLSAVRDPNAMIARHLLDSLAVLPWLPEGRLLDVGTGPGLPGIPIALAQPNRAVTLLESNGKKVRFLRQVCLEMRLDNVAVIASRLEDYRADERFDGVICRAFTDATSFWHGVERLLRPHASALAMKGRVQPEELAGIEQAGVSYRWQPLFVPGLDAERHLLIMTGLAPAAGSSV